MGGRVLTTHKLAELLLRTDDVPVYAHGRLDGGAIGVDTHPHSVIIVFGPTDFDSCFIEGEDR